MPESNHSNYCNNYAILNKLSSITSTKTLNFLVGFERFGTGFARIGTGNHIKQKPEGNPFGRTINNKYELQTASVKNFHFETPYLPAIVDYPANIFIADFHPHNEFVAILPRIFLRPSGKAVTTFIGRTITPSFVGVSFKVLILKTEP